MKQAHIIDSRIINGQTVMDFFATPYGLIAVSKSRSIGLITSVKFASGGHLQLDR